MRAPISLVSALVRSASLRTSAATTVKPLPCSPARAASMAAFRAKRLVCAAMSSIASTITPISRLRWPSACTRSTLERTVARTPAIPSIVRATAVSPSLAVVAARSAAWTCAAAPAATCVTAAESVVMCPRASAALRLWSAAPRATSSIALATCVLACPICSDVPATCSAPVATCAEEPATAPTRLRSDARAAS